MQRYPIYDSYRPSKLPWSPEIPSGWQVRKLTHSISYTVGFTPESGNPAFYGDEYLWANISDLGPRQIVSTKRCITKEAVDVYKKVPAKKGSLLYSFKLSVGQVSFAGTKMFTNEAIAAFEESEKIKLEFFYYLAPLAIVQAASENIYGAKILNQESIGNAKLIIPPISEQRAIARFLDYKTAQIDALIVRKQALLEKLAEKRSALISHAVTKGLDPSVPMKDSGVAWLGEIPAHWTPIRIRNVSEFVTSGSRGWAEHYSDEGSVFLRITNVSRTGVDLLPHDIQRVSPPDGAEGRRTATKGGDVVVSITADLGSVAVIPDEYEAAYVSQHLALVRPMLSRVLGRWMAYQVLSAHGQAQLIGAGYGGTKIQLGLGDIKDVWIALPPLVEQKELCAAVDAVVEELEFQALKVRNVIERLTEYRSALITNAVTGKIDVRGFKLPEAADETAHA